MRESLFPLRTLLLHRERPSAEWRVPRRKPDPTKPGLLGARLSLADPGPSAEHVPGGTWREEVKPTGKLSQGRQDVLAPLSEACDDSGELCHPGELCNNSETEPVSKNASLVIGLRRPRQDAISGFNPARAPCTSLDELPESVRRRASEPLLACQPLSPGEVGPLARRKSMVGAVPQMRRPSTTLSNAATCHSKEKEPGGDWRRKLLPVTSQISTMHTTSKAAQIAKARRASGAYKEKERCPAQGA